MGMNRRSFIKTGLASFALVLSEPFKASPFVPKSGRGKRPPKYTDRQLIDMDNKKGVLAVTTLDLRTSDFCKARTGVLWDIDFYGRMEGGPKINAFGGNTMPCPKGRGRKRKRGKGKRKR
jgi:hypothetical protein